LVSFQQQTPAVQRVLVEEYLDNFPDLQLSRSQFEQLIHILHSNKNYYHILKNDYVLEKNYQNFRIYKIGPETYSQQKKIVIKSEGIFSYDSCIFSLNHPLKDADWVIYFPTDEPILLRGRQAGDTILVNGITKKLRRWFIDHKIPQKIRQEAIIIEQSDKIYGIVKLVTSDLSKFAKNDIIKATLYIKMKE